MVIKIAWTGIRIDIEINTTASPKPNLYIYGQFTRNSTVNSIQRIFSGKKNLPPTLFPQSLILPL